MKPWFSVENGNESSQSPIALPGPCGVRAATGSRLLGWVEGLVAAGLCRPVVGGRFELVCSQAELARRLGLSATSGSISKRLTALERMGVLVCRDPVVFDLGDSVRRAVSSSHADREPSDSAVTGSAATGPLHASSEFAATVTSKAAEVDRLAVLVELLHKVCALERTDLLDRVLEVISSALAAEPTSSDTLWGASRATARAAPAPPLPSSTRLFPSSPLTSSPLTSSPLTSSPLTSSPLTSLPLTSSPPFPLLPRVPASPPPDSPVLPDAASPTPQRDGQRREERYRFRRTPDAAARLQALAPLLEDCARRGLPGVGSPSGLLEAFDGYTLEQITRGVEFIRSQLATASPLRSPVGLLAHMARTGDLALVEDVPVPVTGTATPYGLGPQRDCLPSPETPGEWLARMGTLMRDDDPGGQDTGRGGV